MDLCKVCRKPSENACAGCRSVFYCSAEHQKADWKQHRSKCSPFVIKNSQEIGRHAVAVRSLKAGSLVLEESPVFFTPMNNHGGDSSIPICLGCCKTMPNDSFRKCPKCKWPICSDICEKTLHADLECRVFSENNVQYPHDMDDYYMGLMACRATLLESKIPEILSLRNNCQLYDKDGKDPNSICKYLEERMTEVSKLFPFPIDEYGNIMHIVAVNSKDLDIEFLSNSEKIILKGKYLFSNGSCFQYSCSPNCVWGISPGVNAKLTIRTTVDVKKGDILTVAHNRINYLHGTVERQQKLLDHGEFVCRCDRCSDTTELGSNISTLVCPKCNGAGVTSTSPLEQNASWKCSNCNYIADGKDINELVDCEFQLVQEYPLDSTNINVLMTLITDLSGKLLHPNHWIISEICHKVFTFLESKVQGSPKVELNDEERHIYLRVTEHLLKVTSMVTPGLSKNKAKLLSCISREKTTQTENDFINGRIVHAEFKKEISKLDEMIHDAYQFFKTDKTESFDGTPSQEAISLESRIDQMKTLVLLASNEYLPVKLKPKK